MPTVVPGKGQLITVLNPLGTAPALVLTPMAPRLDTLDGKTIYVVDVKFPASKPFFEELVKALQERYPKTTWVPVEKKGSYFDDDPDLWTKIKAEAHGMIILVGH